MSFNHSISSNVRVFSPSSNSLQISADSSLGNGELTRLVRSLQEEKNELIRRISKLEAQLSIHLETCSGQSDVLSGEETKQQHTKALLNTFLNSFEKKTQQVFFTIEIQTDTTNKLSDLVESYIQATGNEQLQGLALIPSANWDNVIRDIVGEHRNRFSSDFRKQVLATLKIPKSDVPWARANSDQVIPKDKKKRKRSKAAQLSKENPHDQAMKKLQFKERLASAMQQSNWTFLTLTLHTLMRLQKTQQSHVAYACFVMEKLRNGEKLQKQNSDPDGLTSYLGYMIQVKQNKSPFTDSSITLEDGWTRVKSM